MADTPKIKDILTKINNEQVCNTSKSRIIDLILNQLELDNYIKTNNKGLLYLTPSGKEYLEALTERAR